MKKLVFALLFAGIAFTFTGCPTPGNGQTPDPFIGVWKYTSGTGQVPEAAMVSIAADGSCAGAYTYGSSGSYTGRTSIGLWSESAGGYDLSSYSLPVSVTDSSPTTSVGSLSADHNTLTMVKSGTNASTMVYTRVATPASSPLIGVWKYTSGTGQVPEAAMVSIAADGSCAGAYIYGSSGSYTGATSIGLWSVSAGGYDLSSYSFPVSVTDSSPTTSVGSLSADHNTLTMVNSGTNASTMVYARVATPASSPLIGVWRYTSTGSSGSLLPEAAMFSFAADGSFVGAYTSGSSGSYGGSSAIGLWSVSAGGYDLSSYSLPVSVTDSSPVTGAGSLSADHNTLTINNSGTITVFLRQ